MGVIGIIGPWNFPLNLVALPAAAAYAAGNRVMIKMSEITPATSELMKATAPKYFPATELDVVTGGPDVASAFATLPFDHLFFTGSPSVGALVQQAAAQNLVPVTLELGGKNPVVVSRDADHHRSATRIAQARMINGGQVCVCPDYVFVPDDRVEAFVDVARDTLSGMFPSIIATDDYCSSVNQARFRPGGRADHDARANGASVETVAPDGESLPDPVSRKVAPTIVRDVDERMRIANEEIFGPVLIVRPYSQLTDAVDYINQRPAPLVAYWYGPDNDDFRSFVRNTRSGGVARNDFAAHMIPSARRSVGSAAAAWAPITGRLASTRSAITARWLAAICRYHHWTRGAPVQRFDAGRHRPWTQDGTQPHASSAQVSPLIACSRAHR